MPNDKKLVLLKQQVSWEIIWDKYYVVSYSGVIIIINEIENSYG